MIGSSGQSVTYNVTGYKWRIRGTKMPAVPVPECWITRRLTVKLRGRTTTPDERRGRTLSPRARGAKPLTPHGPLQRLLGAALERWARKIALNTVHKLRDDD